MSYDFDVIVIGGGSGGLRAAAVAGKKGLRVMLVEQDRIGGTCIIRGCIPKKLFVAASRYRDAFVASGGFGWETPRPSFQWETLIQNTAFKLSELERSYRSRLEAKGVTIVRSRGVLSGAHDVELVTLGKSVCAEVILLATGGNPLIPDDVVGKDFALTSDHIFEHSVFPQHIIIAGGGYIAVEFAGIFSGLGSHVTLVHRGSSLLRGFDSELADALENHYRNRGICLVPNRTVARIDKLSHDEKLQVTLSGGETYTVDSALFATGRRPNTDHLGLDAVGVKRNPDKTIAVNQDFQSSVPSIYAIGDCANHKNLTPIAIREAEICIERRFGRNDLPNLDYDGVATAVYSTPELATVGLTEEDARAQDPSVCIYKTSFESLSHALSPQSSQMIMKLVVAGTNHSEPGRILGAHMLGEGAGDMIQLIAVGMTRGITKADFDHTVAVHPTAAEEWVTLKRKSAPYTQKN
jgi:glutathione reductase (NADPH)